MTTPAPLIQQVTAHAVQLGDRINTAGFEGQILSNTPLALRIGPSGIAVVFRYGVVVLIGLTADHHPSPPRLSASGSHRVKSALISTLRADGA